MTGEAWTDREAEILAQHYPRGGKKAVQAALREIGVERTLGAIGAHARRLGVWSGRGRKTDLDDRVLDLFRSYHPCPLYSWDVAEELETAKPTVVHALKRAMRRGDVERYLDPNAELPTWLYRLAPESEDA